MRYDSIIFDMDGTIWDTTREVCAAWNKVLENAGNSKRITEKELSGYMGLPMDEIAMRMFKTDNYESVAKLFKSCLNYENEYIAANGAKLYHDLINALEALYTQIPLYIVSNCQSGYIETFYKAHNTEKYFKDYICFGDNGLLKAQNIKLIAKRNGLVNPVYVGDTQGDSDAAAAAGVDFIWAAYGFGSADRYVMKIDVISQLLTLLE